MKDVVLIPAFQRPEFLYHCLLNIKLAHGADRLKYIFAFDYGHSPELYEAVKLANFDFEHVISPTKRTNYRVGKQSFNVLSGYLMAASMTKELVFMIEEDVFIATDFFDYHYQAQQSEPFCSIAVANPNRTMNDKGAIDEYYHGWGDYCSLGVCFNKEVINTFIRPHVVPEYFVNPIDYVRRHFPGSPIGHAFAEQDGLIRRIQMSISGFTAYPYQARAYHAGFYGANRGTGPSGTLANRIETVERICYSDEAMRTFARHPEWYEDSKPIDLNNPQCLTLSLKPLDPNRNPLRV